jgi:hypothetical protein
MELNPYQPSQIDSAVRTQPPVLAALVGDDGGMSIDFEIWQADLIEFNLFHHQNSPASKRQIWKVTLYVCVIVVLMEAVIVYLAVMYQPEMWLVAVLLPISAGIALVFLPHLHRMNVRNLVSKMYAEGRNLVLYGPRRVSLTPQLLNYSSPYTQSVTRWVAIEKIVTVAEALYIYNSAVSSIIIPRRAFSSDDHFQTFVHTAQEFHARALAAENPLRTSP